MGLFNKSKPENKIKVHFIDARNSETIGITELTPEQLPETFEVATRLNIKDREWIVEEANPSNAVDFIKSKKLVLKLSKVEYINPADVLFTIPTISNELPAIGNDFLFCDFDLEIHEDDWRQYEFLNRSSMPLIEIETRAIKEIWSNNSSREGTVRSFSTLHVRNTIGSPNLAVNFSDLQQLLNTYKKGRLVLSRNPGYVKNAFVLKTRVAIYYGVLHGGNVIELAIANFNDGYLDEISTIADKFDLVCVDWCHGEW